MQNTVNNHLRMETETVAHGNPKFAAQYFE